MATKPTTSAASDATESTTPPATDTGAGTTDTDTLTVDPASEVPGTLETTVEAPAPVADLKDLEIAALKAQLIATSAQAAAAQNNTVLPTPPAADVQEVTKWDSLTKQPQSLPAAAWAQLSDEDQKRFTPFVADKPAALPTA